MLRVPKALDYGWNGKRTVKWVFFIRTVRSPMPESALAGRMAEKEQVIAAGRSISFLRSPGRLPFRSRVSQPVDSPIKVYYQPIYFPGRLPMVGSACQSLNVSRLCTEIGQLMPDRPDVVCYDSPIQFDIVGKLNERLSVYYVMDDLTVDVEGHSIAGEVEIERRLLEKVNLVICVSEELAKRLRDRAPRVKCLPIHVLPNFYDERVFDPKNTYPEPKPLQEVPRPRVLVAGHISDRIDWQGILTASKLRPEWSWVFLGRVTEPPMRERIAQLNGRGFLLPGIPFAEVPAWIQCSDACAVPYRLNAFTLASDPIKAPEFLAMGSPVLSTRVPSLSRFDAAIYWIEQGDGASYSRALEKLSEDAGSPEIKTKRQCSAVADSLDARAEQFRTIVQRHL